MHYENILPGIFISRINRFVALVEIQGQQEFCHVKNTGRCTELFICGARVYVQAFAPQSPRKTKFDLIAIEKNGLLINIDSQAPNQAFREFLENGCFPPLPEPTVIRPEYRQNNSRFDFYAEQNSRRALIEIKGVTLETHGHALFPDAPTQRGLKHLYELTSAVQEGFDAYVVFVIQMKGVERFSPNYRTHPEFARGMYNAQLAGVHLAAFDCVITPHSIQIDAPVPIVL